MFLSSRELCNPTRQVETFTSHVVTWENLQIFLTFCLRNSSQWSLSDLSSILLYLNVKLQQKYFPIRFSLSIISMHPQKSFHWLVLTYFTFYFMLRANRTKCCHFRALIPSGANPKVHKSFEQKYLIKLKPLIQPHNYSHIWLCSYRVPSYHQDIPAVLLIYSWTYIV